MTARGPPKRTLFERNLRLIAGRFPVPPTGRVGVKKGVPFWTLWWSGCLTLGRCRLAADKSPCAVSQHLQEMARNGAAMRPDVKIVFDKEPTPEQAGALIDQLRQLQGVAAVEPGRTEALDGAKGVDAIVWSEVLVELAKAVVPNAFAELVRWLRSWGQRPGARAVKLTVPMPDGSTLEVDPGGDSPEVLRAKIDAYRTALAGS